MGSSASWNFFFINRFYLLGMLASLLVGCFALYKTIQGWTDAIKLDAKERNIAQRFLDPLIEKYTPRTEIDIHKLHMALMQAGMRDAGAMRRYVTMRIVGLIVAAVIVFASIVTGSNFIHIVVYALLFTYIAYFAPDMYVQRSIRARQAQIADALPSLMDLMVLCLDVGLSIEASFERVTYEIRSVQPLMAEEAQLMMGEIGAGLTFPQALKRMSERIGLEDLIVLSRLISQASMLGASVATALREYSAAAFEKRLLSIDEKAGKISSMMVLPVTVCMLPAALIALIGPAVIMLMGAFQHL